MQITNFLVRFLILIAFKFVLVENASITIEQMRQLVEPVKLVCIPKTKVSQDALTKLSNKIVDDSKELKCYVNCLFEMMQIVRKL
jgi:hypothetical protein